MTNASHSAPTENSAARLIEIRLAIIAGEMPLLAASSTAAL